MKSTLTLILAASVMVLAGCSSTPTRVDQGPIQARTFNFIDPGTKAVPSYAENAPQIHAKIQEAITKNLAAKGDAKVANGGDLTVGYLVIISEGATTSAVNDYFGYSEAAADLQDKAHDAFVVGNKNRTPYPEGTLVIDLVEAKTWKLVKRNFVCRPIMRQLPMEERVARLQEAVDEALRSLRVAK
ncbi:MAG: DUF4136 domain-containing protein, partial [Lentisphaerota bacterium]